MGVWIVLLPFGKWETIIRCFCKVSMIFPFCVQNFDTIKLNPFRLKYKERKNLILLPLKKHNMKKKSGIPIHDEELLATVLAVFEEILYTLREHQNGDFAYYDNADLKKLLNVSDSTLFRIRKSQHIPYVKIGRKIFYPKSFFKNTLKK